MARFGGKEGGEEVTRITDRISWLQGNPPHLAQTYEGVDGFCDAYAREVMTGPGLITNPDGLTFQQDMTSRLVNVRHGFRVTTGVPVKHERSVYVFGTSPVYGFGSEDAHTIPSLLQARLNELNLQDSGFPAHGVLNRGIRGGSYSMLLGHLKHTPLRQGDLVIFFGCMVETEHGRVGWSKTPPDTLPRIVGLCQAHGIPTMDSTPLFERPHPHGEVFIDFSHLSPRGNKLVADRLFQTCFQLPREHKAVADDIARALRLEAIPEFSQEREDQLLRIPEVRDYLAHLKSLRPASGIVGSIVMNCNPFTLGHKHLIRLAAGQVDHLFVFINRENRQHFNFEQRFRMVQAGTSDLPNVTVLPYSGAWGTASTHPQYFEKEANPNAQLDATDDLSNFGRYIAQALGITKRFAGQEPYCPVTSQYNRQMAEHMPRYGIEYIEVERHCVGGAAVSASAVRRCIREADYATLRRLVPESTIAGLKDLGQIPPDA
ncbi:adenylyltransferase/cytidyltransferase family protein [Humidesulfovibrio mexicanus]|nr:adenylyltransferase/cytidyltransferase family protein [Humidesulfovibrio mexicanus]